MPSTPQSQAQSLPAIASAASGPAKAVQPPGLRILTAVIDCDGKLVRLQVRTHLAQVFDLFLSPKLASQTGCALVSKARRLHHEEQLSAIIAPPAAGQNSVMEGAVR